MAPPAGLRAPVAACDGRLGVSAAILIPSLWRSHRLKVLIENIHATTPEPHKLYFMVPKADVESIAVLEASGETYWTDAGDMSYPTRINTMYARTQEPWLFLGSDDVRFHTGWFASASAYEGAVIATNDLFNLSGTNFLVRRDYIEAQSGCMDVPDVVLYPGYRHNWCDQELRETAEFRGVFYHAWGAIVEHLHWGNHKSAYDDVYAAGDATSDQDREIYYMRRHLWTV